MRSRRARSGLGGRLVCAGVAVGLVAGAALWLETGRRERAAVERTAVDRVRRALCTDRVGASAERIVVRVDRHAVMVSRGHWSLMSPPLREEFAAWASVCRLDAAPVEIRLADGRDLVATWSKRDGYADVF